MDQIRRRGHRDIEDEVTEQLRATDPNALGGKKGGFLESISLKGDLGRRVELFPIGGQLLPPAGTGTGAGNPNGEVLVNAQVVGDDPYGHVINLTFDVIIPDVPNAWVLTAIIEFGSAGLQSNQLTVDLMRGLSISIPATYVRVRAFANVTPINPIRQPQVGCFATRGVSVNHKPLLTVDTGAIAASTTVSTVVPAFAKNVQVISSNTGAAPDTFGIRFFDFIGGNPYNLIPGPIAPDIAPELPLRSDIATVRIINLSAVNAISNATIFYFLGL